MTTPAGCRLCVPRRAPDPGGILVGRQHRIGYGVGASGAAASTGWAEV